MYYKARKARDIIMLRTWPALPRLAGLDEMKTSVRGLMASRRPPIRTMNGLKQGRNCRPLV